MRVPLTQSNLLPNTSPSLNYWVELRSAPSASRLGEGGNYCYGCDG
ncbi:hypothetical protein [Komarekiella delphini-convector]|nr:hypothetical protein [Komarekiella delphini-convector]